MLVLGIFCNQLFVTVLNSSKEREVKEKAFSIVLLRLRK